MPQDVPRVARRLIERHIDSVGRLDLLLVLYGDPRERWSGDRMAKQMRTPLRWTVAQMEALREAGIAGVEGNGDDRAWSYDPADDETADAVQELVSACRQDWPLVTKLVIDSRAGGAQAFSDAFRLRRKSDG